MDQAHGEQGPGAVQSQPVELRQEGHVVGVADVTAPVEPHGTATVTFRVPHDGVPADARGELVDVVMDQPAVRRSDSVHVVLPLGDSATISRLQERTTGFNARAAGASSIIDADLPRGDEG